MLDDRVTSITFLFSFIGHCLILGMPRFNLSLHQEAKKLEEITVRIEIEKPSLLPKIDVLGEEKRIKEVKKELKPPESKSKPEPNTQQEVVIEQTPKELIQERIEVINPAQEAMLRYQDMVKQRIEEVRRYPLWAKSQGIEGTVYLSFVVLLDGSSQGIKIIRSSGSKVLDEEAIVTIKRANPFPLIPKEITTSFVQMEVSIVFTLQ